MKTFSQAKDERADRYAASEIIKNKIDRLIDSHLTISVNGEKIADPNLTLECREELTNKIENLLNTEKLKQNIMILEELKNSINKSDKELMVIDFKKVEQSIVKIKLPEQVKSCRTMLELFENKHKDSEYYDESIKNEVTKLKSKLNSLESDFS